MSPLYSEFHEMGLNLKIFLTEAVTADILIIMFPRDDSQCKKR